MKTLLFTLLITPLLFLQGCDELSSDSDLESEAESIASMANFEWINENIVQPRCVACHNDNNMSAGLLMTNYDNVMDIVVPERPDLSPFYIRSFNTIFFRLTPTEQEIIYLWIEEGALNNSPEEAPTQN